MGDDKLGLGSLERRQQPPPDLQRLLESLRRRRQLLPLVVPEIRVCGAAGDDERVVIHRFCLARRQIGREHTPMSEVKARDLGQQHARIRLALKHTTER